MLSSDVTFKSQFTPDDLDVSEGAADEFEEMLYARHVEIENFDDLETQRGTPIPALFSQFYKFIQNPSSVSVETFKRMVDTDDTIGSGVDFLTTCLAARIGRYTHPSKEITEWVNSALGKIEGGFANTLKEMLSASWAGFSVSEKVWENTNDGFVIKKLVTLPPGTILFETERTGELSYDGILQYQRNFNPFLLGRGLGLFGGVGTAFGDGGRADPFARLGDMPFPLRTANSFNYLSIRIPKQKCVHYSFDAQGKFGNPYGRSLLRRAYKYYTMKDAFLQMMSIALDRKGTALTIVYSDPNTVLMNPEAVPQGTNPRSERGKGIRADEAARQAFRNIHNDSVIFLPGKKGEIYETDFMPQASNTADFIMALDFCNKSLMRSLLIPSLVFGSGDGSGSWALGQEHSKTFDKLCDGINGGLVEVLKHQVIKELIAYNFPAKVWQKEGLGEFGTRELSAEEVDKQADLFNKGINDGYIDVNDLNDLNQMREVAGFEPKKTPIINSTTNAANDKVTAAGGGLDDAST